MRMIRKLFPIGVCELVLFQGDQAKWERRICMGKINVTRVLFGGLLTGFVLNIGEYVLNGVILAEQWFAFIAKTGLVEIGAVQALSFVIMNCLVGIGVVWIYAAIRPRFEPGPKTAAIAGLTVWAIGWLYIGTFSYIYGISPAGIAVTSIVWGLFEVPIAAVVGAWLYREDVGT